MAIQRNEISFFTWDFKVCLSIFKILSQNAPIPFYEQDYEKQKRSETSYLSLLVVKHVHKNSLVGLAHWIWKLERKGKNNKTLNISRTKSAC